MNSTPVLIDGKHKNLDRDDVSSLLGDEDKWFFLGCPVKYGAPFDLFLRAQQLRDRVADAFKAGKIKEVTLPTYEAPNFYVQSDYMGGSGNIHGLQSMADGKYYDSKSAYYKSVKEAGLTIVGNEAPAKGPTQKEYNIDWKGAVAETLKQTPLKGK